MREYGQIQTAFWQAPDIASLGDQGKLLAAYLLTGTLTNGVGCFKLGDGQILDDLGWPTETVSERFAELSRNGFAYRLNGVVFLPNFLRWNTIANSNIAQARFKDWEQVPKGDMKSLAARAMLRFSDKWTDDHRAVLEMVAQTVTETVWQTVITAVENQHPIPSHPTPSHPTHVSANPKPAKVKPVPERFEAFWAAYPKKVSKADAIKAFAKLKSADVDAALTALPHHARHWAAEGRETQYIPNAATWLNGQKWTDDLSAVARVSRLTPPKPSRQAAIAQTLLQDPRYAHTAARQSGLALQDRSARSADAYAVIAGVPAGAGHDPGDGDGVD